MMQQQDIGIQTKQYTTTSFTGKLSSIFVVNVGQNSIPFIYEVNN
jgi:hypothetical protein